MTEQTIPQNQKRAEKPTHNWKRRLAYILVALLLVASSSIATYIWQQQTVTSLNNKLTSQNNELDFIGKERTGLNEQLGVLSTKNAELLNKINTSDTVSSEDQLEPVPPVSNLNVSVLSARQYTNPSNPAQNRFVAVDMTVTNKTSQALNLEISDFQLSNDTSISRNFGLFARQTMPNGLTVLDSQVLAPGQTVKGAMVFNTLNHPAGFFTLTYKSETFKFTLE